MCYDGCYLLLFFQRCPQANTPRAQAYTPNILEINCWLLSTVPWFLPAFCLEVYAPRRLFALTKDESGGDVYVDLHDYNCCAGEAKFMSKKAVETSNIWKSVFWYQLVCSLWFCHVDSFASLVWQSLCLPPNLCKQNRCKISERNKRFGSWNQDV